MTVAKKPRSSAASRRKITPLVVRRPTIRVSREQRQLLCELMQVSGARARYAVREVLILVRHYRENDASFRLAENPALHRDELKVVAKSASDLLKRLADLAVRDDVEWAHQFDNKRRPTVDQKAIDVVHQLEQVVLRAQIAASQYNKDRRGVWLKTSNHAAPPLRRFLSELVHLWHAEFGLSRSADVKSNRDDQRPSALIRFCQLCVVLAGEQEVRNYTMRNRINTVLAAMDDKAGSFDAEGRPTSEWRLWPTE